MDTSDISFGKSFAYLIIILFSTSFLVLYHPAPSKIIRKNKTSSNEPKFTDKKPVKDKKDAKTEERDLKPQKATKSKAIKKQLVDDRSKVSDKVYFEALLDNYLDTALLKTRPGSRTDIVIRYYKKAKDEAKVYSLRGFGYYVHERPAELAFTDFESNAIFYGDSVSNQDIQLIAYALVNSGLKIQQIAPSKYHDTWKAHSVEIGSDTTVLNQPVVTLSTIREKWGRGK